MNHLFHVKNYLIENSPVCNENNCDIDSIIVFDTASMDSRNNPYCVVISHTFSDEAGQGGDVRNQLFDWRVLVNFFRLLEGSKEENAEQIQDAYLVVRDLINLFCADFTLGGNVMDSKIHSVLTPMTYSVTDRDEFIMIGIVLTVKEALNG